MTVKELIEELQKHPPELRVVVDGYEGGLEDLQPKFVYRAHIELWSYGKSSVEAGCFGPHAEIIEGYDSGACPREEAVIVAREGALRTP